MRQPPQKFIPAVVMDDRFAHDSAQPGHAIPQPFWNLAPVQGKVGASCSLCQRQLPVISNMNGEISFSPLLSHRAPDNAPFVDAISVIFIRHNLAVLRIAIPTAKDETFKRSTSADNTSQIGRGKRCDLVALPTANSHEHTVTRSLSQILDCPRHENEMRTYYHGKSRINNSCHQINLAPPSQFAITWPHEQRDTRRAGSNRRRMRNLRHARRHVPRCCLRSACL